MLNRRLIALFILFTLAFCALAARLTHLQINESQHWREQMRTYVHKHNKLETARGTIVDRNGIKLAFDDACYDLAIDYRAMNLDDRWLKAMALKRIQDETFPNKLARTRRVLETKAAIAEQIEAIPDVIARFCDTSSLREPDPDAPPREKILARFDEIRQLIRDLRQDRWSRAWNPDMDKQQAAAGEAFDDAAFNEPLKEEHIEHTIIPNIPDLVASHFLKHADEYPGLVVINSHVRRYVYKSVACHLLGTLRSVDADTLKKNKFLLPNLLSDNDPGNLVGYLPGDRRGESGLERLLEMRLRGIRGARLVDSGIKAPATAPASSNESDDDVGERRIDPILGQDVKITLDISLQQDLEKAITDPARGFTKGKDGHEHSVALVVLSLDGQVLAMLSTPGYDPNTIDDTRVDLNKAFHDRPLANRALEAFRPGSTVKPLLAAAGLSEKVITPEMSLNCPGYLFPGRPGIFKCAEVHNNVELVRAIAESCNVYFYNVGDKLGVENLVTWFHGYGFGRETSFELPDSHGIVKPTLQSRDIDTLRNEARFMGIGEGPIDVTPLQLANGYATLLRAGKYIAPRIIADTPVQETQALTISAQTLATVKQGMRGVITHGTGTSTFRDFRLPVGGKTGTADVENKPVFDDNGAPLYDLNKPLTNRDGTPKLGRDKKPLYARVYERGTHAWFVGYAPADNPKFVVVALKEFGGFGGQFAAPMVKEAFIQLQRHNYLPALDIPLAAQP